MSGSTTKNIVKLLFCKFDLGDCGGLCGKGDQRGTTKKTRYFGGHDGLGGLIGLGGHGGRDGQGG